MEGIKGKIMETRMNHEHFKAACFYIPALLSAFFSGATLGMLISYHYSKPWLERNQQFNLIPNDQYVGDELKIIWSGKEWVPIFDGTGSTGVPEDKNGFPLYQFKFDKNGKRVK